MFTIPKENHKFDRWYKLTYHSQENGWLRYWHCFNHIKIIFCGVFLYGDVLSHGGSQKTHGCLNG